jgi:hypothetical protein
VAYVLSTAWVKPGKEEELRAWYAELSKRREEVLQGLGNEGVRQEVAFIVPTEHGEMLCVFIEVDDMDKATSSFFASPYKIDQEHRTVMDSTTQGGMTGRVSGELMYAFQSD